MKKLSINLVIGTLIFSTFPLNIHTVSAEEENKLDKREQTSEETLINSDVVETEVEYEEEDIVLFSEKPKEDIDFFETMPEKENDLENAVAHYKAAADYYEGENSKRYCLIFPS